MQWVLFFGGLVLFLYFIAVLIRTGNHSRSGTLWLTWFVVVLLEQTRNLVMQVLIWWFLLRRCGQVPLLDEDVAYAEENAEEELTPFEGLRALAKVVSEKRKFDLAVG